MSINRQWIDNRWYSHAVDYYLTIKRMRYWHILLHGWTLKTSCWVKKASHKRLQVIQFHPYEMSGTGKSKETESRLVFTGVRRLGMEGLGNDSKKAQGLFLGQGKCSKIDCSRGWSTNHWTVLIFKWVSCVVCELYLKNTPGQLLPYLVFGLCS